MVSNSKDMHIDEMALDKVDVAPANKLDAEHYTAEDLDGITEGLFGSGNVSHASLQASQTSEMMENNNLSRENGNNNSVENTSSLNNVSSAPAVEGALLNITPADIDTHHNIGSEVLKAKPSSELNITEGSAITSNGGSTVSVTGDYYSDVSLAVSGSGGGGMPGDGSSSNADSSGGKCSG
jgi:hypothetical protein